MERLTNISEKKEKLFTLLKDYSLSYKDTEENTRVYLVFMPDAKLFVFLNKLFSIENELIKEDYTVFLDLKNQSHDFLVSVLRFAIQRDDLCDTGLILNLFNLVKTYNTLDDSFLENEDIYISSMEALLDLKQALREELKEFTKKLSVYFISLIKSYGGSVYKEANNEVELPNLYRNLILSADFLTLSAIFSITKEFSTEECICIKNAEEYINSLLFKNLIYLDFFEYFLEEDKKQTKEA